MSTLSLCVFAILVAAAVAEVPEWTNCDEFAGDVCNVSEIRINPCKEIKYCKLKKGKEASIQIDFTPNFDASKVKTGMFWSSDNGDVPFSEVYEVDGCQYTPCPLEAGKQQQFDFKMHISKKLPNGKFPIKFKLWHEEDKTQACCFKTSVELRK